MNMCERCGKEMPDTAAICPSCGTASSSSRPDTASPGTYGQNPPSSPSAPYPQGYSQQQYEQNPPSSPSAYYEQGYNQQYGQSYPPQQPGYAQPPQQGSYAQPGYGQSYQIPPIAVNINMPMAAPVVSSGNSGATIVEVLLTIFLGIYGVGWLMAGETTTGIILLICSFLLYWPLMILGTIFTIGIGLICLVPLAIGAIILNAILLSNAIKRKTTYILVQQMQPFPPR